MFDASKVSAIFCLLTVVAGCGPPAFDAGSALGKQAILDQVNLSLTKGDCAGAIATLKPVYNSGNTDNRVRMLMAAAYGCSANVNLFTNLGDLVTNSAKIAGPGFWEFVTTEFPSTFADRAVEAAQLAQDALQAVISPGAVILPANLFNTGTFNPASFTTSDRSADSNAYLFFVSMSTIGGTQKRYGSPFANGKRGVAVTLPWTTATAVTADGCAYASAIVNFVDSLGGLAASTTGSTATTFAGLQSAFQAGIYAACESGCTTCNAASHCTTCPLSLRNRTSCTSVTTDQSSCATAGITSFINTSPAGWAIGP